MTLLLIEAARILKLDPAQGWPQTITHYGLAALQTYREGADNKTWHSKARTWREALALAVASGAIEHTSTTARVQVAPAVRRVIHPGLGRSEWDERGFQSRSFLGGTLRTAYTQPAQHKNVVRHHITAPAFAAWLAAQGQEPSPHIDAWFTAVGTPTAPATDTAPPTPVTETKEQRQDKRLQACIDAGLPLGNTKAVLLRLPDGMSAVAKSLGIARQSLTADVKAALQRRLATENVRGTVHRAS